MHYNHMEGPAESFHRELLLRLQAAVIERGGFRRQIEAAQKAFPKLVGEVIFDPGHYRGMTLFDVARECLEIQGVREAARWKQHEVAARSMRFRVGADGTSDFSTLLENLLWKVSLGAYVTMPTTWRKFCGTTTVQSFQEANLYRLGSFGALSSIGEHGEIPTAHVPDATKSPISVDTKAAIYRVSYKAIVNDDLDALRNIAEQVGRAAALTIESLVYSLLTANGGLGDAFGGQSSFFNDAFKNVGTDAALSADALAADTALMASQTDASGNEILNLRPNVLLVPLTLEATAKQINRSAYDPSPGPEAAQGVVREVIGSPRLAGNRRYLFADPTLAPAIMVAFLAGDSAGAPMIEKSDNGRNFDGLEWRARLDVGAAFIDPKPAVSNAGQ